jgi:hypothetical protein
MANSQTLQHKEVAFFLFKKESFKWHFFNIFFQVTQARRVKKKQTPALRRHVRMEAHARATARSSAVTVVLGSVDPCANTTSTSVCLRHACTESAWTSKTATGASVSQVSG